MRAVYCEREDMNMISWYKTGAKWRFLLCKKKINLFIVFTTMVSFYHCVHFKKPHLFLTFNPRSQKDRYLGKNRILIL